MRIHMMCHTLPALLLLCHAGRLSAQSAHDAPPATQPAARLVSQDLVETFNSNANFDKQVILLDSNGDLTRLEGQLDLEVVSLQFAPAAQGAGYLGVGVALPDETLRSQLGLAEGAGLVVNYVDDKGPCKDAVHRHDVLRKLDDQILVNAEQLVTLVRMHKADETISLTLIREAKPLSVQVKLGTKQEGAAPSLLKWTETQEGAARVAPVYTTRELGIPVLKDIAVLNKVFVKPLADGELKTRPITFNDGELLACLDGSGNLVAIDVKTGNVLFHGPITTEAQWNNAPQLVRDKMSAWHSLIVPLGPPTDPNRNARQ